MRNAAVVARRVARTVQLLEPHAGGRLAALAVQSAQRFEGDPVARAAVSLDGGEEGVERTGRVIAGAHGELANRMSRKEVSHTKLAEATAPKVVNIALALVAPSNHGIQDRPQIRGRLSQSKVIANFPNLAGF